MYNRKKIDDQDNSKIENIAKLVLNGKKNRIVLVNTEKVDEYLELMCADDPSDF